MNPHSNKSKNFALAAFAVMPFILLTGCANMSTSSAIDSTGAATIAGTVHGGIQPVANATVYLYAAGTTGYGTGAKLLQQSSTDANGNFNLTNYTCPGQPIPAQLYIIASGGQPTTGTTNSAAAFMAALGPCPTVKLSNPTLNVNEVTTIASMFAVQQFFTPGGSNGLGMIGTTPGNTTGMATAFATAKNLVNLTNGTAIASTTSTGPVVGFTTAPVVTITPEQAKINTLANILAACINTSGAGSPNCTTLFSNVSSSTVVDTLEAAYYLATNPTDTVGGTSKISTVYGLSASQPPFAPALNSAPADWTIGVTYGSKSTSTGGAYFLSNPAYIAIDAIGNVWVTNTAAGSTSLSEMSALGLPLTQALSTSGTLTGPRNTVIDPSGNIWVENALGSSVLEYTLSGSTNTFTTSAGPNVLASDGSGNIFVGTSAPALPNLVLIPANSSSGTTPTTLSSSASVGANSTLAIDAHENLWVSNAGNTATVQFLCTPAGSLPTACTGTSTTAGGQTSPAAVSVDRNNNIWVGNLNNASVSEIAASTTSMITGVSGSPFSGGGITNPISSTIDGLGNYWATNNGNPGGVGELSAAGTALAPSAGFAHTYAGSYGIAVDGSGNVWIGNANATASPSANGFVTEIVGAAGPLLTPLSAELPSSLLGTRPSYVGTRP
jgi:hypothetical protein